MHRWFSNLILFLGTIGVAAAQDALTAFPGAEGFGAQASGGRDGRIYHVTNLNDDGAGSLRAGVENPTGPGTILFDVGGYVTLKSVLHVGSDLTIAGQTAPGEGIGIRGAEVSLSGSHNVIIRYLRLRQGLAIHEDKKSAVNMLGAREVIFDHVSIQWGRWDTIDMNNCSNITVQDCIIGPGVAPQRFGCLCQSDNVSFIRNLWVSNQSRNPKAKGRVQYVNNVVYNWGVTGYVGGHSATNHWADLINNYFIKGPSSNTHFVGEFKPTDQIYQSGNYADLDRDGSLNGRPVEAADFGDADGPTLMAAPTAVPPTPVVIMSATEAYQKIVAGAGDSLHRDSVDRRLVEDVTSLGQRGQTVHDPAEMGGFGEITSATAQLDMDADGIPKVWKSAHSADYSHSRRTLLEEYLNWLTLPSAKPLSAR